MAKSHLGTALSVGGSVDRWFGGSVFDTKLKRNFRPKIQHKMDTMDIAVTRLGVPALVNIQFYADFKKILKKNTRLDID